MQIEKHLDADLARPLDGSDQIGILALHVRLVRQQILDPVADRYPNSVQSGRLDLDKVVPGDERTADGRGKMGGG
jgi:hypothetical protein